MNGDVVVSGVGTSEACVDLAGCASFTYDGNGEYFTFEDTWTVSVDSVVVITGGGYGSSFGSETIEYGDACPVSGCTDELACNFNADAEVDNGSCTYAEEGYDCDGNCLADADGDLICDEFEIPGCTDETATNYDSSATDDDGSCIACSDNSLMLSMYDAFGDGWNGATVSMTDGTNTYSSDGITSYSDFDYEYLCVPTGCYEITVGGGDYDYEISFIIGDFAGTFGTFSDVSIGGANCDPVFGCTDAAASNCNPEATDDDGSCEYAVFGCTDETADNYNVDATEDDGSCIIQS